jgi:hypothetical protein
MSGLGLGHPGDVRCTTALPPRAEVHPRCCYVAEVPGTDIIRRSWSTLLTEQHPMAPKHSEGQTSLNERHYLSSESNKSFLGLGGI